MAKFDEVRKGYSKEQVDAYIKTIADEYEKLLAEYQTLEDEYKVAKEDTSYNEAMVAALVNAELAGKQTITNAKVEANRIVALANQEMGAVNQRKAVAIEEIRQLVARLNAVLEDEKE